MRLHGFVRRLKEKLAYERNTTGKEEMNKINVKEKCWKKNAWNKRKRHKTY